MEEVLHEARLLLRLLLRLRARWHRLLLPSVVHMASGVGHHAIRHHHRNHWRQDRRIARLLLLAILSRWRLHLQAWPLHGSETSSIPIVHCMTLFDLQGCYTDLCMMCDAAHDLSGRCTRSGNR